MSVLLKRKFCMNFMKILFVYVSDEKAAFYMLMPMVIGNQHKYTSSKYFQ